MYFKSMNYYFFYIIFFNLFEKFFFFFKINNEFFNSFLKCKITFFLDPLGKHSFLSSINFFFLQRLFYSFPQWIKVLYIRRINRSISKRRRFMSKINKGMHLGFFFFMKKEFFFNYFEILCRYTLPFFFFNKNLDLYNIIEYFFFKNEIFNNHNFYLFMPRILFHLGNEPFFESFYFLFESSFSSLTFELFSKLNHFFYQKILISHLGFPIN